MKLFYAPGSSSLLPHIALHEAGLPFEAIKINEHTKVTESGGDYWKVNPLGYVPALVLDDGTLLTEGADVRSAEATRDLNSTPVPRWGQQAEIAAHCRRYESCLRE